MCREKTIVIFRKDPDGEIFALFPEEPSDNCGNYCSCYQHLGGHGGADYHKCINASTPATPREFESLSQLLHNMGYFLTVYSRASDKMHARRRRKAKQIVLGTQTL
jgi:hypothetical protein